MERTAKVAFLVSFIADHNLLSESSDYLAVLVRGLRNEFFLESSGAFSLASNVKTNTICCYFLYCYPSLLQYVPRSFQEAHRKEIVSLELTIALMLLAHGLTVGVRGSADRMFGWNHRILPPPSRLSSCDGKNHLLPPSVHSQVSHNIIMSSRRVKLSLRNSLPYVVKTCGRIGLEAG
jgi:hypothetical protein